MGLTVPNVFAEDGDTLSVGVSPESIASLLQNVFQLLVVGDDTVVDQAEFGDGVADVRVAVAGVGNTVGGPSSVSHRSLRDEDLGHVDLFGSITVRGVLGAWEWSSNALGDVLSKGSDFADLLEEDDRGAGGVTIDTDT